jgi:predicted DNA-binding protein (UPF0278 family)
VLIIRIESFVVINLRGVSTNKTIICFIAMQTYKELIKYNMFYNLLCDTGSSNDSFIRKNAPPMVKVNIQNNDYLIVV